MDDSSLDRIRALDIWQGRVEIEPLAGGLTNRNFLVRDGSKRYVARLGADIPVHHIRRANELAASRAAHAAGLSPAVVHHLPGLLVLDYIDAQALTPDQLRAPEMLERVLPLLRACHQDIPRYFRGDAAIFWVFHVIRDYLSGLIETGSPHRQLFAEFLQQTDRLEAAAGPYEIVFGHNDLLAANFLDDGNRLWLIDWDYAGFNTPLFDLGGLASNNQFSDAQERWMLERYFGRSVDAACWRRYSAMKCASLLRETLWSMVSEQHSTIDFDYSVYTAENLGRFARAYADFLQLEDRS